MSNESPLLPEKRDVPTVTRETAHESSAQVIATRDHELIREWARSVSAEPATGEETPSGPAPTMKVVDGGTGLRFNFPGMGRFRQISWAEWFDHFTSHDFTFVCDNAQEGEPPTARYRIVPTAELMNG